MKSHLKSKSKEIEKKKEKGASLANGTFVSNPYTKVMVKIVVDPVNYPVYYHLEPKFESTLEFNYTSEIVMALNQSYEINGIKISFDKIIDHLVEDTHFALREKHFSYDFEKVKEKLGYTPDVTEFNEQVRTFLNSIVDTVCQKNQGGKVINLDDTLIFKNKISVA